VHSFNGARNSKWRALEKRCSTDRLVPGMAKKLHTILEIIGCSESWSYAGEASRPWPNTNALVTVSSITIVRHPDCQNSSQKHLPCQRGSWWYNKTHPVTRCNILCCWTDCSNAKAFDLSGQSLRWVARHGACKENLVTL
jgi:hypothetical protein